MIEWKLRGEAGWQTPINNVYDHYMYMYTHVCARFVRVGERDLYCLGMMACRLDYYRIKQVKKG